MCRNKLMRFLSCEIERIGLLPEISNVSEFIFTKKLIHA
jgi:hypothetical protein